MILMGVALPMRKDQVRIGLAFQVLEKLSLTSIALNGKKKPSLNSFKVSSFSHPAVNNSALDRASSLRFPAALNTTQWNVNANPHFRSSNSVPPQPISISSE